MLDAHKDKQIELARYIASKRPDLSSEVDDVMSEEFGVDNYWRNINA